MPLGGIVKLKLLTYDTTSLRNRTTYVLVEQAQESEHLTKYPLV